MAKMENGLKKKRDDLKIRPCEEKELDELMRLQENIYENMEQRTGSQLLPEMRTDGFLKSRMSF